MPSLSEELNYVTAKLQIKHRLNDAKCLVECLSNKGAVSQVDEAIDSDW